MPPQFFNRRCSGGLFFVLGVYLSRSGFRRTAVRGTYLRFTSAQGKGPNKCQSRNHLELRSHLSLHFLNSVLKPVRPEIKRLCVEQIRSLEGSDQPEHTQPSARTS